MMSALPLEKLALASYEFYVYTIF